MRISRRRTIASALTLVVLFAIQAIAQQESQVEKKQDKPSGFYLKPNSVSKEVSFNTEDGWTIYGTLTVPATHESGTKLPAVLFVHSSMHSQTVWVSFPGFAGLQQSLVTLRIDIRGRGKSEGPVRFVDMSESQREKVALDVEAAVNFLAAQESVDVTRIGIIAEEFSVSPVISATLKDPRVCLFVFLSGLFSDRAMDLIASSPPKPTLYIVSNEDTESLDDTTKAYEMTRSAGSEIWVQDRLGVGVTMCNVWRNRYHTTNRPLEEALDVEAGQWFERKIRNLGRIKEVTLRTQDGWILYANLGLPDAIDQGQRVPGVILMATAMTDRQVFRNLERLLLSNGIAFLNLEYRGIGKSVNKGTYIEQSFSEIMEAGRRDLHDGYAFLASQEGVDPNRIGALGAILSANYAMYAARENPKLKALVLLDLVVWNWSEAKDRNTITSLSQPILMVTGDGVGETTKGVADLVAANERNKVIRYPGAIVAYLHFRRNRNLEPTIVEWLKEHLAN